MKDNLLISIIQADTYWENPVANRSELEEIILSLEKPGDLLVLPEMFTTGFSTRAEELAEPMNFTTHKWMKQIAAQSKAAICGSIIIKDKGQCYNRLLFVYPNGVTYFYDKRHLFAYGGEQDQFSGGNKRLIVSLHGWNICPLICYDLRFPVFARNSNLAYDILLYSASWPKSRVHVWDNLLKARAIENQAYVLGANRLGVDGNKIEYCGHSTAIDPKGIILKQLLEDETVLQIEFSKQELIDFRVKFPAHLDADPFELKN